MLISESSSLPPFSDRVQRILTYAEDETRRRGGSSVGTLDVLTGFAQEGHGLMARVLATWSISFSGLCNELGTSPVPSPHIDGTSRLEPDAELRRALRYAAEEAKASGWKVIGSEHLLIGVLRVDDCAASKLLANKGMNADAVRARIRELTSPTGCESPEEAALLAWRPCRVVASAINGDDAFVLFDTGPDGRPDLNGTCCHRSHGQWFGTSSSGSSGWSPRGPDSRIGILAFFDEAPKRAEAVRVEFNGALREVPVTAGAYLTVWWDITCPSLEAWPRVAAARIGGEWVLNVEPSNQPTSGSEILTSLSVKFVPRG